MAEKTPTAAIVEQLLAARNEIGQAAVQLEAVLETIRGKRPSGRPAELGAEHTERGFVPSVKLLAGEIAGFSHELKAQVDELVALL